MPSANHVLCMDVQYVKMGKHVIFVWIADGPWQMAYAPAPTLCKFSTSTEYAPFVVLKGAGCAKVICTIPSTVTIALTPQPQLWRGCVCAREGLWMRMVFVCGAMMFAMYPHVHAVPKIIPINA